MKMRGWIGVLLLLNLVALAWQWDAFARWGWGPNVQREPERLQQQIQPEALKVSIPGQAASAPAVSTTAVEPASEPAPLPASVPGSEPASVTGSVPAPTASKAATPETTAVSAKPAAAAPATTASAPVTAASPVAPSNSAPAKPASK
ncbi:MAG: hypothetical protein CFE39_02070 [Comamonadaceae bacterium PBBC2]|nr:MAG: hypothetical protein CFE39_02070 [Comamonadaceae bacterium PBBC2]